MRTKVGFFMATKLKFNKQHLTTDQHIELLENRGLLITDKLKTIHRLNTVSYYRLSAYFKPFLLLDDTNHRFQKDISFENIWSIYVFDRELSLLVSNALERLEIALRTSISNVMTTRYGNLWYLSSEPFTDKWIKTNLNTFTNPQKLFMNEINDICDKKKEESIKHYYSKYDEPLYPPSWMIIECLSFGRCTSLFRNLSSSADKKLICEIFNYYPTVIESSLESLRYTRNLCAHHARLWNRWFVFSPKIFKAFGSFKTSSHTFHETLYVISKLHNKISPKSLWKDRLHALFMKYDPDVPFHLMGFAKNWENDQFWLD